MPFRFLKDIFPVTLSTADDCSPFEARSSKPVIANCSAENFLRRCPPSYNWAQNWDLQSFLPKRDKMSTQNRTSSITRFPNSIVHGDCLRLLPELPEASVDLKAIDPSYIVDCRTRDGPPAYLNNTHDPWLKPAIRETFRLTSAFCV